MLGALLLVRFEVYCCTMLVKLPLPAIAMFVVELAAGKRLVGGGI